MASPLNQYAIYDCNILRINLNEMVERRASSQGKELTDQEIDDIAVVLRRKIDWEPIFNQIDEYLYNCCTKKKEHIYLYPLL